MKHVFWIFFLAGGVLPVWGLRPVTQVEVSRPTTQVQVSRPQTSVSVVRPQTYQRVSRPSTQVNVSRPVTQVDVSKPVTQVNVSRPATEVNVSRPTTFVEGAASQQAATKTAALSAPSSEKKTSMSDYKPPVAKDFTAAATGGGEAGLGNKINQAQKDASAAATQAPKAQNPSGVSAAEIMSSSPNATIGNSLLNKLKQKAAGRSASK